MRSPRGPRNGRATLRMESLEDRTVPGFDPALPLAGQIASGDIAGDRVIVVMNDGASAAALAATPGVRDVNHLGFDIYRVRLTPGTDLGTALAQLGGQAGVTAAEPDQILQSYKKPNDAFYGRQYGTAKIGAETVWNTTTGNPNFVVGVIDEGIDYAHPDIAANMWRNPGEIPGNGTDDDRNGYVDDIYGWDFANDDNDPMDVGGHGTHVAGTIGAVGNNARGLAGVNWNVKLMALNILGPGPFQGSNSAAIAAVHYSVLMGVKVTNNSYGGAGTSVAFSRAINRAQAAGQIFVAASGNDGLDNDVTSSFPTNYFTSFDNVVSVAATDNADRLADFSNYGLRTVTLVRPASAS